MCANTPALIFPLGNLWFWSIYLQEQSCTVIPCVFLLCAQVPVFWLCVLPSAFCFFSSYPQIISANAHALVRLCRFVPIRISLASLRSSPPPTCTRVASESLSDCDGLECCPGSLRVRRPPCLSSTAAQTMAPHGPALRLIERLQPESEMVQSDRVAFYAGSIARASTLTSTISSIIHQAMPPG